MTHGDRLDTCEGGERDAGSETGSETGDETGGERYDGDEDEENEGEEDGGGERVGIANGVPGGDARGGVGRHFADSGVPALDQSADRTVLSIRTYLFAVFYRCGT